MGFENQDTCSGAPHRACGTAQHSPRLSRESLVITLDGLGDGLSGTVSTLENGKLERHIAIPARRLRRHILRAGHQHSRHAGAGGRGQGHGDGRLLLSVQVSRRTSSRTSSRSSGTSIHAKYGAVRQFAHAAEDRVADAEGAVRIHGAAAAREYAGEVHRQCQSTGTASAMSHSPAGSSPT